MTSHPPPESSAATTATAALAVPAAAAAVPDPFSFRKLSLGLFTGVAVALFVVHARASFSSSTTSSSPPPLVTAMGAATTFGIMFMCVGLMLQRVHRVVATVFCYAGLIWAFLDIFFLVVSSVIIADD